MHPSLLKGTVHMNQSIKLCRETRQRDRNQEFSFLQLEFPGLEGNTILDHMIILFKIISSHDSNLKPKPSSFLASYWPRNVLPVKKIPPRHSPQLSLWRRLQGNGKFDNSYMSKNPLFRENFPSSDDRRPRVGPHQFKTPWGKSPPISRGCWRRQVWVGLWLMEMRCLVWRRNEWVCIGRQSSEVGLPRNTWQVYMVACVAHSPLLIIFDLRNA